MRWTLKPTPNKEKVEKLAKDLHLRMLKISLDPA
jgi:hypothetical protein